ncbi:PCMD domain-containing protein [uncultured Bacteroides sp.]|uniref:PCMD domain-containing protein n=1 Tax=uncultured Bacteroides sp. TaxID=162156 RepID=UPI0025EA3366|nr:PCMD domain-containing protein [uncultured Bacteroides sp.]
MKMKKVLAGMMMCLAMVSCIQDEALNVEAAIDGCRGKDIQQCLIDPNAFTIQLYVSKAADLSKINLLFELPAGATVAPEQKLQTDGTDTYNFEENKMRKFKVTSEDGAFSATYEVRLWQTEMPTAYGFEMLSSLTPYHVFYEEKDEGHILRRLEWSSGNPGYKLTAQAKTPLDYPTVQVNGGINGGKCVKLETKDTGSFGSMVKMYIAAGNLFIGSFEVGQALNDAMKATRFGFPYFYRPQSLKGHYKYKAGPQFSVKGEIVEGKKDQCDIYGVLYETDDNVHFLDGSNSLTSENIVALARNIDQLPETDDWKEFNFDFELKKGKSIDSEKLKKGIYKLAIVFSSSVDGAKFEGAVGSTLYVDQVEIVNYPDSNN